MDAQSGFGASLPVYPGAKGEGGGGKEGGTGHMPRHHLAVLHMPPGPRSCGKLQGARAAQRSPRCGYCMPPPARSGSAGSVPRRPAAGLGWPSHARPPASHPTPPHRHHHRHRRRCLRCCCCWPHPACCSPSVAAVCTLNHSACANVMEPPTQRSVWVRYSSAKHMYCGAWRGWGAALQRSGCCTYGGRLQMQPAPSLQLGGSSHAAAPHAQARRRRGQAKHTHTPSQPGACGGAGGRGTWRSMGAVVHRPWLGPGRDVHTAVGRR
jgi:hypothetical protein